MLLPLGWEQFSLSRSRMAPRDLLATFQGHTVVREALYATGTLRSSPYVWGKTVSFISLWAPLLVGDLPQDPYYWIIISLHRTRFPLTSVDGLFLFLIYKYATPEKQS